MMDVAELPEGNPQRPSNTVSYAREEPQDVSRVAKRRKGTLACDECREKKRRCDGVRPRCGKCCQRDVVCSWSGETSKRMWTTGLHVFRETDRKCHRYVASLQARIRHLEDIQCGRHRDALPGQSMSSQCDGAQSSFPVQRSEECPETAGDLVSQLSTATEPAPNHTEAARDLGHSHDSQSGGSKDRPVGPSLVGLLSGEPDWTPALPTPATQLPEQYSDHCGEESGVNAMGMASGPSLTSLALPASGNFGPSSAADLLNKLRQKIVSKNNLPSHDSTCITDSIAKCPNERTERPLSVAQRVLPCRGDADTLVGNYYSHVHSLYPFLHWPSFLKRYEMIWRPLDTDTRTLSDGRAFGINIPGKPLSERSFYPLLNAVFAIGSQFYTYQESTERFEMGNLFFARAKGLLTLDDLVHGNLAVVQTLLLLGQYLQSTDMAAACWNIVGVAIRIAQGLGLHLEHHIDDSTRQKQYIDPSAGRDFQIEIRRRVWLACVTIDRVVSTNYGRTPMIELGLRGKSLAPIPFLDEFDLSQMSPGSISGTVGGTIACWKHSLGLLEMVTRIQVSMAPRDLTIGKSPTSKSKLENDASLLEKVKRGEFTDILRYAGELRNWRTDLPDGLRWQNGDSPPSLTVNMTENELLLCRLATNLRLRFISVQIILFRPVLLHILDTDTTNCVPVEGNQDIHAAVQNETCKLIGNLCIQSAQELVHIIAKNLEARTELLPPWWYTIFYIHHCAIIILVGRLCRDLLELEELALQRSWQQCFECLKMYLNISPLAKNSMNLLAAFEKELSSAKVAPAMHHNRKSPSTSGCHRTDIDSSGNQSVIVDAQPPLQVVPDFHAFDMAMLGENFENGPNSSWMDGTDDMAWFMSMPFVNNGVPLRDLTWSQHQFGNF